MNQESTAELLTFGNELLIGRIINSNASWIAGLLTKAGFKVTRIITLSDDLADIKAGFSESLLRKPDVIISTGGLGPTWDDRTLEGLSLAINKSFETNSLALKLIEDRYQKIGAKMNDSAKKMANFPSGARPLRNSVGTAPGLQIEIDTTKLFCVPGVPSEMKAIFSNEILPKLTTDLKFFEQEFVIEGLGESSLAHITKQLTETYPQIYIKSHPTIELHSNGRTSVITFHITTYGDESTQKLLKQVTDELKHDLLQLGAKLR